MTEVKKRILDIEGSTHLKKVMYLPDEEVLVVKFISGSVYRYDPVSATLFGRLAASESVGTEFAESIRFNPNINYTQLPDWPEDNGDA